MQKAAHNRKNTSRHDGLLIQKLISKYNSPNPKGAKLIKMFKTRVQEEFVLMQPPPKDLSWYNISFLTETVAKWATDKGRTRLRDGTFTCSFATVFAALFEFHNFMKLVIGAPEVISLTKKGIRTLASLFIDRLDVDLEHSTRFKPMPAKVLIDMLDDLEEYEFKQPDRNSWMQLPKNNRCSERVRQMAAALLVFIFGLRVAEWQRVRKDILQDSNTIRVLQNDGSYKVFLNIFTPLEKKSGYTLRGRQSPALVAVYKDEVFQTTILGKTKTRKSKKKQLKFR